jgi:hypothetical protein
LAFCLSFHVSASKRAINKVRDGATIEKKQQELEKRLENVKGALGAPTKKTPKKGENCRDYSIVVRRQKRVRIV